MVDIAQQSQYYRGLASIGWSYALGSEADFETGGKEDAYVDMLLMNDVALAGFYAPVSSGRELTDHEVLFEDEDIPCIIGGVYANRYKIGSRFTGFVMTEGGIFSSIEDVVNAQKAEITLRVVGKMKRPEQTLDVGLDMSWSSDLRASKLIENRIDSPLIAVIPEKLYPPYVRSTTPLTYLFFSKDIPEEEIIALDISLGDAYAKMDTELIESENQETEEDENILGPFVVLLLLTSTTGVIALCLLTTVRNLHRFSVYRLLGCTFSQAVGIISLSAVFYILSAAILFFGMYEAALKLTEDIRVANYYFNLSPEVGLIVGVIMALVIFSAFISGILALKNQSISSTLKSN
jgi:hypothetical protein